MSIRYNPIKDSLLFYELLEESETMEELEKSIDNIVDALRQGIYDLCLDNKWDYSDLECDII